MKKRPAALIAADIPVFAVCLAAPWLIDLAVRHIGSDWAYAAGAAAYAALWAFAWLYAALSRASGLRLASLTLWVSCGAALVSNIVFGPVKNGATSLPRLIAYVTSVYYTRPVASLFGEPDGGPRGWCALACAALTAVFAAAYIIMPLLWKTGEKEEPSEEPESVDGTGREMSEKIDKNPYTEDN